MSDDDLLLTHAALVALTPLVPLPFVDEMARRHLERRLLRELARRHTVVLSEADIELLTASTEGFLDGKAIGRRLLLMPFKWVFKRVLLALRGKAIIEAASLALHRAALYDAALERDLVRIHGPDRLREAVEATLKDVPIATSPVTAAIKAGLTASQDALARGYDRLRRGVLSGGLDGAYDGAASAMREDGGLAGLRRSLSARPREHLARLERDLLERLND